MKKTHKLIILLIMFTTYNVSAQSNLTQYYYDNLNQLTKVEQSNGVTIEYFYDELGNRIGKTVTVVPNYDVYFTQTPTIPQDTATAGDVLQVASSIGNRGNTATHSDIHFYWSLDTLKDGSDVLLSSNKAITKTIAANKSVKDSFLVTLPSSLVNSGGYILCVLDDNDNLTELDETNNIEAIPLNIIALPVELLTFTGEKTENGNLLKWTTASELNNKGFDIERSEDGDNFEKIGFVDGQGTTLEIQNYDYLDNSMISKLNYYRLKQIDFDNAFEYSKIVIIRGEDPLNKTNIAIYPNPTNGSFEVVLSGFEYATYRLEIYNTIGQLIQSKDVEIVDDNQQIPYNLKQKKGLYYLKLYNIKTPNEVITLNLIIQ